MWKRLGIRVEVVCMQVRFRACHTEDSTQWNRDGVRCALKPDRMRDLSLEADEMNGSSEAELLRIFSRVQEGAWLY